MSTGRIDLSPDWPWCCPVVIPRFNTAGIIRSVVRAVRGILPRIIMVDDNSMDAESDQAATAGAEVIHQAQYLG